MKAVILAGGLGSRLSEETYLKPKPMVEIGEMPIILHIMKYLSFFHIRHFIICCGYKHEYIKNYFIEYLYNRHDLRISTNPNSIKILNKQTESWKIDLVYTGADTQTGGRLKKIKKFLKPKEKFLMTYGDGLSNIDIKKLISFANKNKKKAIVTAVKPKGRFGVIDLDKNNNVKNFKEKPQGDNNWINGGYFILNPEHLDYIKDDKTAWEVEPLQKLTQKNLLSAFKHNGFWKAMDTLSDKKFLEDLWYSNNSPWKIW